MLGIHGESLKGVRLNAPKDGLNYKGKNVYVIGGADGAVKETLYLAEMAGVFAAGDIRVKKVRQVATAVSDGAIAGIQAAAIC